MKFTFVTLFSNLIEFYFQDSILKKAVDNGYIKYDFYNPRDFTTNKHNKVDDYLCGGGAGLLMNPQPLFDTLNKIKEENSEAYIIFPLASAKPFTQNDAKRLAKKKNIVIVSGRYEGIDERVIEEFGDEVFSIGNYVLTGGELPSLILADSISRNVEGVLGNSESLDEESFENIGSKNMLEAPSFTKPATFRGKEVPPILLGGNHQKIKEFKQSLSICKTKYYNN
jgi:tRNA (guanine37-N1)-methyltransferase